MLANVEWIESCIVHYWALFLSFALFLIIGFKSKWDFFPATPAPGWEHNNVANPATALIPIIDPKEGCELKIVSYKFSEDAHWHDDDLWSSHLQDWSRSGVKIKLVGGRPQEEESKEFLKTFVELGAEVRFLKKPPTRHIVICSDKPLIWIEEYHKENNTAHRVFYNIDPEPNDLVKAHKMFDSLWSRGAPIAAM